MGLFPTSTIGIKWSCWTYMYVWLLHVARVRINRVMLPNPARGQLSRENKHFLATARAWEFGLARRVRQSHPTSSCSSPHSCRILCLLAKFLLSSAAASIWFFKRHIPSGQSRVNRVTQLRTDGVHCRESADTGPVNLKVLPNGYFLGRSHHEPINMRLYFPHPLLLWNGHVEHICMHGHHI